MPLELPLELGEELELDPLGADEVELGDEMELDPLGDEPMLDEPLGEALLLELVLSEPEELDELGLLELPELFIPLEPDCDELPEPETPSAESVCESSCPVALMPCCCWNCFSAARVLGPILPSALTFMPFSLSACCASRTSDELELELFDDREEALLPIDDMSLLEVDDAPLLDELGDWDDVLLPAANAAVLESTIAASVSLRRSI